MSDRDRDRCKCATYTVASSMWPDDPGMARRWLSEEGVAGVLVHHPHYPRREPRRPAGGGAAGESWRAVMPCLVKEDDDAS